MSEWGDMLRLAVVVRLENGREVAGEVFLQPLVPHHSGPETPLDLLEREERFFPMSLGEGDVVFVNRALVAVLKCDPAPPESEMDWLAVDRFTDLDLELVDGLTLRGTAGVAQPPTRFRAIDCLNAGGGFLPFRVGEAVYYINRAYLRVARPIE